MCFHSLRIIDIKLNNNILFTDSEREFSEINTKYKTDISRTGTQIYLTNDR